MSQELYKLQAASLANLDRGALAVAMEQALQQASRDCMDRHSQRASLRCDWRTGCGIGAV